MMTHFSCSRPSSFISSLRRSDSFSFSLSETSRGNQAFSMFVVAMSRFSAAAGMMLANPHRNATHHRLLKALTLICFSDYIFGTAQRAVALILLLQLDQASNAEEV